MRFRAIATLVAVVSGLIFSLLAAAPAQAHGPVSTLVKVSTTTVDGTQGLTITARVPIDRLDFAYGTELAVQARADGVSAAISRNTALLTSLATDRVSLQTPDGVPWTLNLVELRAGKVEGVDAIRLTWQAVAPSPGQAAATLRWDLITDEVATHQVFVGGIASNGTTQLLDTLNHQSPTTQLTIEATGTTDTSSRSLLWAGFNHFREGADHLLFLSLLGLGLARRRTRPIAAIKGLALLTVTFTVGHSLSLALATAGWVSLPSRWVEVAIAVTIVLAAAYAVKPVLPVRAEVLLTLLFGLIHGFGFAGTLAALNVSGSDLIVPLLSFNLGLEIAQIAALALVAVPLWFLAQSRSASLVLAGIVGVIAASWILERAFVVANPLQPILTVVLASPERFAALLALAALAVLIVGKARVPSPPQARRFSPRSPRAVETGSGWRSM